MKLHLTATSERGKPVTKSGNEYIFIEVKDENRSINATIEIIEGKMIIWHNNFMEVNSYKDVAMGRAEPKTAREVCSCDCHKYAHNKECINCENCG